MYRMTQQKGLHANDTVKPLCYGGVVQGIERWITNPAVASSRLAPATIL